MIFFLLKSVFEKNCTLEINLEKMLTKSLKYLLEPTTFLDVDHPLYWIKMFLLCFSRTKYHAWIIKLASANTGRPLCWWSANTVFRRSQVQIPLLKSEFCEVKEKTGNLWDYSICEQLLQNYQQTAFQTWCLKINFNKTNIIGLGL